jgi:formate hydrogenlyase transcriptional activator
MSLDPQRVDRQQKHHGSDPAAFRLAGNPIQKMLTTKSGNSDESTKPDLYRDERELQQIVDLIPQTIIVLNPDGKALYANRVALEYTGLSLDEVRADSFRDRVFHPEDIRRLREERQNGLAGTIPFENEQRALSKDGRYRWSLIQYSPLRDENGEVVRWYATGTDIEERQQAQAALAKAHDELESERDRLRLLVEAQKALVTNLDLRSLLTGLAASLRRVTECDFVGLSLPDSPSGELRIHFACYLEGRGTVKEGMTVPLHGSASGKALRSGQLVCLNKAEHPDPEIYDTREGQEFYQFVSLNEGAPSGYFLPLVRGNEVFAVLQLTKHGRKPLKAQTAEFLSALAGQLSAAVAHALEHASLVAARERLASEQVYLREEVVRSSMFEEIVGSSKELREIQAHISRVAPTNSTVLIQGETGTGKELIARAIHNRSKRANRAFICVNCAAISPSLIASELFGHEKGAFTGAFQRRLGRFESADGGTIFLDEVGELPPEMQTSLLRVLQEREFERVGGNQPIHVDVRVLAATNRDLDSAVNDGSFRKDLFYRLNVFPIHVRPLRERVDDIPLLAEYLVDRYAKKAGKPIRSISKRTLQLFESYDWPGNVRELQNVIERAVIVCDGETFQVDASWLKPTTLVAKASVAFAVDVAEREKAMIENALRDSKGRISGSGGAAAKLGLPRQTLESKIRKLRINRYRYKTP